MGKYVSIREDGSINAIHTVSLIEDVQLNANGLVVIEIGEEEHVDYALHYYGFEEQEWLERPSLFSLEVANVIADGVAALIFTNIPEGTKVKSSNHDEPWTINTGELTIRTATSGEFTLEFDPPFPFRKQTVRVTAHD